MNNTCKHYNRDVRGFIATDDIVHHVETCRDCKREVYHTWHYNDGMSNTARDMNTRVVCDYRPIADAPSPESETVNEILSQEPLTVNEMTARMPEGWTLVSEEHFNRVVKIKNDNFAQYNKLRGRLSNMRLTLISAAMLLGEQGGATHKDKDEGILQAIAKILRCARECDEAHEDSYTDDIPF